MAGAYLQARSAYIRSGWKSIFSVLSLAAKENSYGTALPRQAWEIVRRLVDEDMGSLVYDFLDVTKVWYVCTVSLVMLIVVFMSRGVTCAST